MSQEISGGIPPYQPAATPGVPGTLVCPKCQGTMRTFDRNGVHIEQCMNCRGVFLDFGELEHLTQLDARLAAATQPQSQSFPQQGYGYTYDGPEWGNRGNRRYRKGGFSSLFFSS